MSTRVAHSGVEQPVVREQVGLVGLLAELSDLHVFTRAPRWPYRAAMASSRDPVSVGAAVGSSEWFANHDSTLLEPGVPLVLLDVDGPGVVTRMWSANPSGTLRIYLDHATVPLVEAPMRELLGGEIAPFVGPLAFESAGGYNFYVPIPYARHCRITVESDARRLFYQINHRRYDDGVPVESLSERALREARGALEAAAARLRRPDAPLTAAGQQFVLTAAKRQQPGDSHDEPVTGESQSTAPVGRASELPPSDVPRGAADGGGDPAGRLLSTAAGGQRAIEAPAGGGVIEQLTVDLPPMAALRDTVLSITFDDTEAVRVPLGDFFGTRAGMQPVESLPLTAAPETGHFVSRWPMPFAQRAVIALEQAGGVPLTAAFEVTLAPRRWDADSRYFYAAWHPPERLLTRPIADWALTHAHGEGSFVGTVLNVVNETSTWWGEGDEKLYVDDAPEPSHFGTGTEDYFGYAWCSNERFSTPFIGQTLAGDRRNWGSDSLYRFHLLDAVPFARDFRFELERNHWSDSEVVYDAVVYFYARPGALITPTAKAPALYTLPIPTSEEPSDVASKPYRCGGPR